MIRWLKEHKQLLAYLFICFVAAAGFYEHEQRIDGDASSERRAAVQTCQSGNDRIITIRDVLVTILRDPTEQEFAWIEDPELRAGALANAKVARARYRAELQDKLQPRNCEAELPKPPEEK